MLAIWAVLLPFRTASGQPAGPRVLVIGSATDAERIAPWLQTRIPNATIETQGAWSSAQSAGVDSAELDPLRQSDRLISEARRSAAELDEPTALRRLAEAERLLTRALAVPGVAAFYAEVQLQLGVTAAQLGLIGLAEASFARAARLDGRRRLLAAEAAPSVVSLAARVFDEAMSAQEGEVRIESDAPGARVFVDDAERGALPVVLRARVGVHALRIEAPSRAPYGTLFDMVEGRRPAQRFVLAVNDRSAAVERLVTLLTAAKATALAHAAHEVLTAAPELAAVAWFERDAARDLLFLCDREVCRQPLRAAAGVGAGDAFQAELSEAGLESARGWLHLTPPPITDAAGAGTLWQSWYFWSAVAATVLGAGVLIAIAAQPKPQRTLRVSVDPGDLH